MHERINQNQDYLNLRGINMAKNPPKTPAGSDYGGDTTDMTQGGHPPGK